MRSVTLTLSEDDLYRLYMALHEKAGYWNRLGADAARTAPLIAKKYIAVLDRIQAAYQECLTEGSYVGSEDEQEDFGGI